MDIEIYIEKCNLIKNQFNKAEEMYHSCVEAKLLVEETNDEIYRQLHYMETDLEEINHLCNKRNLIGNINLLTEENYYTFAELKNSTFYLEESGELDKCIENLQRKQEAYMEELRALKKEFNEQ